MSDKESGGCLWRRLPLTHMFLLRFYSGYDYDYGYVVDVDTYTEQEHNKSRNQKGGISA